VWKLATDPSFNEPLQAEETVAALAGNLHMGFLDLVIITYTCIEHYSNDVV
jgi:hypothetical protein